MSNPSPYPAWSFPPKVRAALWEAQAVTQAPLALVGGVVLSTMSLVAQDLVKVRRLDGLVCGCSLFVLGIADSGERKSTVEKLIAGPAFVYQNKQDAINMRSQEDYGGEHLVWEIERKALMRQLNSAMSDGEPGDEIKIRLIEHLRNEPIQPRKAKILYSDATPAAFLFGLYSNSRSAGLIDDDAGRTFSSRLVDDLGLFNKAWDGSDLYVDRRSSESFVVKSPRVTLSWMVQRSIFETFMERKGDAARGIGFLARCLVAYPPTTQGTRLIHGPSIPLEHVPRFHDRLVQLLQEGSESGTGDTDNREELHFAPDAQAEWVAVFNLIEQNINPGGAFCEHRDYASKVAENIARVAGVFHRVEGYEGVSISLETLRCATQVVLWYAQEFIRLFSPPDPLHETIKDAYELQEWLVKIFRARNWEFVEKNFILQRGPNKLRNKNRLDWALNCLSAGGRIRLMCQGRKLFVQLNFDYFVPASQGQVPMGFLPLS